MGCCISKCTPDDKQHPLQQQQQQQSQFNKHLQDKLVISQPSPISQTPTTTTFHYSSNKISPSPPSPTSSISSLTCTTSNTISSSASSFSSTNSLTSKDRSFSNEFLWSCYKENPHITRIKESSHSFTPKKIVINPSPIKQPPPQNMPQKRMRSNSPTNLTRQKSFRKEVEVLPLKTNNVSRMFGSSPSPSRRFNTTLSDNSVSKRMMNNTTKVSCVKGASSSPNNSSRRLHSSTGLNLRHRETKIDETVVKDVHSSHHHNMDSTIMEDIDNPLISLDCFIFL
ncbi:uncharacterized protein [Cicer arietinum]|uniref:Probable serine/threonine-protein kinase dyrk2 n=1 Tax=Cicer arietinum TaxID=3827 RepID=A0A3Q7YB41_CICAR|nr:probable serine/threonine-protein kinase dyrk2 [Cicer arietinum]